MTYGLAEFVAAEEMGRTRGYWWSPDGGALLVARVDVAPVGRWYIADPANPDRRPREVAYPAAGTANADVSLWLLGLDGSRREVRVGPSGLRVRRHGPLEATAALLIVVQSRDQRRMQVLEVEPASWTDAARAAEDDDPRSSTSWPAHRT